MPDWDLVYETHNKQQLVEKLNRLTYSAKRLEDVLVGNGVNYV